MILNFNEFLDVESLNHDLSPLTYDSSSHRTLGGFAWKLNLQRKPFLGINVVMSKQYKMMLRFLLRLARDPLCTASNGLTERDACFGRKISRTTTLSLIFF